MIGKRFFSSGLRITIDTQVAVIAENDSLLSAAMISAVLSS